MPFHLMPDVTYVLSILYRASPELGLMALSCIVFLAGTFVRAKAVWMLVGCMGLAVATLLTGIQGLAGFPSQHDFFAFDDVSTSIRLFSPLLGIVILPVLLADSNDERAADMTGCLLCACAGVSIVSISGDLIVLFLGLEAVSIPSYVMLYLAKADKRGQEAAAKYFLLSVFSSALFLFGLSYLYGLTGQTRILASHGDAFSSGILETLSDSSSQRFGAPRTLAVALVFVVAGLGMKITAVPFHFYAPDVYQGTSAAMAGFLSWFPKAAGLVALVRVLGLASVHGEPFGGMDGTLIWILAVVTMTIGNCLAIWQGSLRRLLAYSGVAQGGYMLASLAAGPATHNGIGGVGPMVFYLASYGIMSLGAFAILAYLDDPDLPLGHNDDLAGLAHRSPCAAFCLAVCLLGFLGLPLTVGFVAKAQVILATIGSPASPNSALIGILGLLIVVNAAVAAWYYLGLIQRMYLRLPIGPQPKLGNSIPLISGTCCAILTVLLGVAPGLLSQLTLVRQGSKSHAQQPAVQGILAARR
ncbi:MAG: NADH-quinone oxidoreductase subunit N [Planctomycetes bacterium]|nr:NADH-quinone oxidoreductase subunit N [Planctomycetota bacterium]